MTASPKGRSRCARRRAARERPAKEVKLKSELSTKLTDHWIELLSKKLPLDDNLAVEPEVVIAGIDADANKMILIDTEVDLAMAPLSVLAKIVAQLDGVKKVTLGYLKARLCRRRCSWGTGLRSEGKPRTRFGFAASGRSQRTRR